mmetsp:Transcript_10511/g.32356  ORF Transcript_10511/g.32356 Transcript_10511/m.32356 type:complete len:228 (+) Transcript_10511:1093-1776(+)
MWRCCRRCRRRISRCSELTAFGSVCTPASGTAFTATSSPLCVSMPRYTSPKAPRSSSCPRRQGIRPGCGSLGVCLRCACVCACEACVEEEDKREFEDEDEEEVGAVDLGERETASAGVLCNCDGGCALLAEAGERKESSKRSVRSVAVATQASRSAWVHMVMRSPSSSRYCTRRRCAAVRAEEAEDAEVTSSARWYSRSSRAKNCSTVTLPKSTGSTRNSPFRRHLA